MGSVIKFDEASPHIQDIDSIFTVAVTACTANKFEASREELTHKGISEIDAVLTAREFFRFVRTLGIDMRNIEPEGMDAPYQQASSASWRVNYSGGKAESVAIEAFVKQQGSLHDFRFNIPKNASSRKESRVQIGKKNIGFAWVSGIAEADAYVASLIAEGRSDIHYIEVMACPGGCVGGGGQPINRSPEKPKNRKKLSQEMEKTLPDKTHSAGR